MIDWSMIVGQEVYEQGKFILNNERGNVLIGKVGGIYYDPSNDMTTVYLHKAIAVRGGRRFEAVPIRKITFKSAESWPLQIESRAVKFKMYPYGGMGILVPKGIFLVQAMWEAVGLDFLTVPYGTID